MRPPYQRTRLVPIATRISTSGASFAFMLRARSAMSTLSRLCSSNLCCSNSSRANARMTRIDEKLSCRTETISPSFFLTSRDACLIRRV